MLKGWKKITKDDIELIKDRNKNIEIIEYFNSIICQMYGKMMYKEMNNELLICKGSTIMGNYSLINYGNMGNSKEMRDELSAGGITLRGHEIKGRKDKFGNEYIYDTNKCIEMEGVEFKRFRKVMTRYKNKIKYETGYKDDMDELILKYPVHQNKFFDFIRQYLDMVKITRIYYEGNLLGFSIVENINKRNGIIIQELINHECGIHDASYLVHYYNCLNNKSRCLNAGGVRTKEIKFAKNKLRPSKLLTIRRIIPEVRLTKEDWQKLKRNLQ